MKSNGGISLITLIVTIVVIIILATIALFNGLDTPNQASLARFVSEFSDFNLAISNDYANRAKEYALKGLTMSNDRIYYMIASGQEIEEEDSVKEAGLISELELDIMPVNLIGTKYFEISGDKNVAKWPGEKTYYTDTEKHYLTDAGEAFILPGFLEETEEGNKWWVNDSKYYFED